MTYADAISLAEAHRQSLVRDLQGDLQREAKSLFLLESLISVVALKDQSTGLVDDVRAEDSHCFEKNHISVHLRCHG